MKKNYFILLIILCSTSFGQVINEFEPNPTGSTDPTNQSVELKGTPSSSFNGYLVSIESDGFNGTVDRAQAISGTFDANGLLLVSVPDLENPSFTYILCEGFSGTAGTTDIDPNNDGTNLDTSSFTNILDAIGIPDSNADASTQYGALLGFSDFAFTGDEPQLIFRESTTNNWYAINDPAGSDAFDINASAVPLSNFSTDPSANTFGSANPSLSSTPCSISLQMETITCNANTTGGNNDGVTITIPYTGSDAGITSVSTTSSGTIGGDDPANVANGSITITGLSEGDTWDISITGGNCSLSASGTIATTLCDPAAGLPIYEGFDYSVGQSLNDQSNWTGFNSGDDILVAGTGGLTFPDFASGNQSGNHVAFDGSGAESKYEFQSTTTGSIYTSFILRITDISSITDLNDGAYIAALANSDSSYDLRFWVRPNTDPVGSTFDVYITSAASSTNGTGFLGNYNVNDNLLVVMSYNLENGEIKGWVNPSSSSFSGTEPTPNFTETDSNPESSLDRFVLRQDSSSETPSILFDELRIGTTWASVTPVTLSTSQLSSLDFTTFPNPAFNEFTITTNNTNTKMVEIYSILGKKVINSSFSKTEKTIDISNLSSGVYYVKVTDGTKVAASKLIVE